MIHICKVAIVIPCYNSTAVLKRLVSEAFQEFSKASFDLSFVLVEDSSPSPDSWKILQEIKQQHGEAIKIVRLAKNAGQHNAIICGLTEAREADIYLTMDDDHQHTVQDALIMTQTVVAGHELVIGKYHEKLHSKKRNFFGSIVDNTIRSIYGLKNSVYLSSFRAFNQRVRNDVIAQKCTFPYVTCMLLSSTGSVVNVPVEHQSRAEGASNYNLRKSLLLALNLVFTYSNIPLKFIISISAVCIAFLLLAFLYLVFSLVFYGPVVPGWISTIFVILTLNTFMFFGLVGIYYYLYRLTGVLLQGRQTYSIRESL